MSRQINISNQLVKYIEDFGYRKDPIINELVKETKNLGGVSQMQIAPEQGQFLKIIVEITKAKKCLEIGRFTGLSSLCIAQGLSQNGRLITVDNSEEHLLIANKYWEKAGVEKKIESVIGNASDVMQNYIKKKYLFDLIFIDADKNNYGLYYELSLNLLVSNGIIIIDNVLWDGAVSDSSKNDQQTKSMRELNNKIKNDNRVEFSLLPLADGISFIRKK